MSGVSDAFIAFGRLGRDIDNLDRYACFAKRAHFLRREAVRHKHSFELAQVAERVQRDAIELMVIQQKDPPLRDSHHGLLDSNDLLDPEYRRVNPCTADADRNSVLHAKSRDGLFANQTPT